MIYDAWRFLLYGAVLLLTVFCFCTAADRKALFQPSVPGFSQLWAGLGLASGILAVVGAVNLLLTGSFSPFQFTRLSFKNIAVFLLFQLLVAVTEEALFRGYLLRCFQRRGIPLLAAIVLSAVLFGALHWVFQRDLIQLVMATLLGLVFAFVHIKWKPCTLCALILAHFLYDISVTNITLCILPFSFCNF